MRPTEVCTSASRGRSLPGPAGRTAGSDRARRRRTAEPVRSTGWCDLDRLANADLVWARGSVRQTIERPDKGANHNVIYDCTFDSHGDYWISAAGSGVRYRRGQWQTVLEPGDRPDFYPTTMVRTPAGDVVVQAGNRLVWLRIPGGERCRSTSAQAT